jgi:hypothetical protein
MRSSFRVATVLAAVGTLAASTPARAQNTLPAPAVAPALAPAPAPAPMVAPAPVAPAPMPMVVPAPAPPALAPLPAPAPAVPTVVMQVPAPPVVLQAPATPNAPVAVAEPVVQFTSLRLMREKGIITQAEYESALHDLSESSGVQAPDGMSLVVGKWSTTIYGFVDADYIYDSTQSFNDLAGSGLVAKGGTFAGNHPRSQFSIRNSRLGFRFRAPEFHAIRGTAVIETDFLGSTTPVGYNTTSGTVQLTENQFFTSPVPRIRHAYVKEESPIVDALFGQTWHLFGWQGSYHPNTVQYQGVPGELYSRTPQLRLSKTLKTDDVTFDIAIAAMRPPQRDSAIPEGEGALHFAINHWTGVQTQGATGTSIAPASIAVSGDVRTFAVQNFAAAPTSTVQKSTAAIAVDAFLPVIPGSKESMGNSLSILGEFVNGSGIADMYTGLTGGVPYPALPAPAVLTPAQLAAGMTQATQQYSDIDPGFAVYDAMGTVHFIQWQTIRAGIQYYFPGVDGKMWLSANYSNVSSNNSGQFGLTTSKTLKMMNWFDVNLMGDLTPAIRLGIEYANYMQTYNDESKAMDHRVQGSAFYIF